MSRARTKATRVALGLGLAVACLAGPASGEAQPFTDPSDTGSRPGSPFAPVAPPPPLERDPDGPGAMDRVRAFILVHMGFGGVWTLDVADGAGDKSESHALDTTFGFEPRVEVPVLRYLVVGTTLRAAFWSPERVASGVNTVVDVDALVRGRLPFEAGDIVLAPYVAVPIGLSVNVLAEHSVDELEHAARGAGFDLALERVGLGWNVGVLAGLEAALEQRFLVTGEIGWVRRRVTHEGERPSGARESTPDTVHTTSQLTVVLGAGVGF